MRWRGLILFLLFSLFNPAILRADTEGVLNSLLAPGPLMGGHKELEGAGCFKCHDVGKGIALSKCLECHKEIKSFVEAKKGFHGLTTKSCTECHSDHKGRDYDSISVDIKTFDHAKMTGYVLEGKHAEIKCEDCHTAKRVGKYLKPDTTHYFGAKSASCVACHKKDDVHFFVGKFAKADCNQCHGMKSWKTDVKFDHNVETRYKLEEKHAQLSCNECHLTDKNKKTYQYQWPKLKQDQCMSCHADFHKQNLSAKFRGGDCLKCHNQTHWKLEKFNHEMTGYPLRGKHIDLRCTECHKQSSPEKTDAKDLNWTGLKSACLSCHQDVHKFGPLYRSAKYGNMNACLKCHDEASWKKVHDFAHDTDTRYAIDGKHLELKCEDCHLPKDPKNPTKMPSPSVGVYHWQKLDSKTCEECHANPHINEFKAELLAQKCTVCHVTAGWKVSKSDAKFDHAQTRFPLTGAHVTATCNSCHLVGGKKIYKFPSAKAQFCIDCHQNVHKKQFSDKYSAQACSQCHSTDSFSKLMPFDHSKTNYPLEGSHAKLKCAECHIPTSKKFDLVPPNVGKVEKDAHPFMGKFMFPDLKQKQCMTCHQDYHKGQLGTSCQNCHGLESWKKVTFDHNKQSKFKLFDKHATAECSACHKAMPHQFVSFKNEKRPLIHWKPLKSDCVDCHKDVHKGSFGTSCTDCHNAKGWKVTNDFHKNFNLTGVHQTLDCTECHRNGQKLAGVNQDCMFCHQKDDIHHGTLPDCKKCHAQTFWDQSYYKHSLSRFPLRGVHRTIDCNACHFAGGSSNAYQGLSTACESCHLKDALAVTNPSHAALLTNCQECHLNQFSFSSVISH